MSRRSLARGIFVIITIVFMITQQSPIWAIQSIRVEVLGPLHKSRSLISATFRASNLTTDSWPMYRGSPDHAGVTSTTAIQGNGSLWKYKMSDQIAYSSPAVASDRVYIGNYASQLVCLNATTGNELWSYLTKDWIDSSPAVISNFVYFGSDDAQIYCLDATSGTKLWNYTTKGSVQSSPSVASGRVYVGSLDGNMYCLNAFTGAKIWNYSTKGGIYSSPALANGYVYFGSDDNKVYCLNATTGLVKWTKDSVDSSPTVVNGRVYIESFDGKMYCLDAISGTLDWSSIAFGAYSSPSVDGGRVFVANNAGAMLCLDSTTGALLWNYTSRYDFCPPAIANGFVYFGGDSGMAYCLDEETGGVVWTFEMNWFGRSSPAISGGCVYIGCGDGTVYCLPMLLPSQQGLDSTLTMIIVLGVIAGAIAAITIIVLARRKARSKTTPIISAPRPKYKNVPRPAPSKPFNLYCQLCDEHVTMDGDYVVSGLETCKTCGEPMHFTAKCGQCGKVLVKPVADLAGFAASGMPCEACGGEMTLA